MGLNVPLAFYGVHVDIVKHLSISSTFPLRFECEAKSVVQIIECKYLFDAS
jgi:hypothetical protein